MLGGEHYSSGFQKLSFFPVIFKNRDIFCPFLLCCYSWSLPRLMHYSLTQRMFSSRSRFSHSSISRSFSLSLSHMCFLFLPLQGFWLDLLLGAIYLKLVLNQTGFGFVWRVPLGGDGEVTHKDYLWHCAKQQSASSYKSDQYLKANMRIPRQRVCTLYVGRCREVRGPTFTPPPQCFNMCLAPQGSLCAVELWAFVCVCLHMYLYVWVWWVIGVWWEVSCGGYYLLWSRHCLWTLNQWLCFAWSTSLRTGHKILWPCQTSI